MTQGTDLQACISEQVLAQGRDVLQRAAAAAKVCSSVDSIFSWVLEGCGMASDLTCEFSGHVRHLLM